MKLLKPLALAALVALLALLAVAVYLGGPPLASVYFDWQTRQRLDAFEAARQPSTDSALAAASATLARAQAARAAANR